MARTSIRPMATRMVGAGASGAATRVSRGPRSSSSLSWCRSTPGATRGAAAGRAERTGMASEPVVPPPASREARVPGEGTGDKVSSWPLSTRVSQRSDEPGSPRWEGPGRDSDVPQGDPAEGEFRRSSCPDATLPSNKSGSAASGVL